MLLIIFEIENVYVNIVIICFDIFCLVLVLLIEFVFLCDYLLCYFLYYLEEIDKDVVVFRDVVKIVEGFYWLFGIEKGCFSLL